MFEISYARREAEAKRLTTKYYDTNWNSLNPTIQEVLIDMVFRGDLRPTVNSLAQNELRDAVKKNDLEKFKQVAEQYYLFFPLSIISMFQTRDTCTRIGQGTHKIDPQGTINTMSISYHILTSFMRMTRPVPTGGVGVSHPQVQFLSAQDQIWHFCRQISKLVVDVGKCKIFRVYRQKAMLPYYYPAN